LYDVIVAENLLADLLSDLAGQVAGGLGLTAGTNMNYETRRAYFEPTHGSAPDIVGSGRANPIGQIRSGALMLEFLGMTRNDPRCLQAADLIERAIEQYLSGTARELLPIELGGRSRTEEVGSRIGQLVGAHA
jgi:isocitrate/isopropylmalate dehydrogenase